MASPDDPQYLPSDPNAMYPRIMPGSWGKLYRGMMKYIHVDKMIEDLKFPNLKKLANAQVSWMQDYYESMQRKMIYTLKRDGKADFPGARYDIAKCMQPVTNWWGMNVNDYSWKNRYRIGTTFH